MPLGCDCLHANVPEPQQLTGIRNRNYFTSTERPQIIVEMPGPDLGALWGRGLRSGPRSLGDESGPDITTTPVSTIINISRLRGRRHAAPAVTRVGRARY
jgi:hypothetical protein